MYDSYNVHVIFPEYLQVIMLNTLLFSINIQIEHLEDEARENRN